MIFFRNLRCGMAILAIGALFLVLTLNLTGCSDTDSNPTGPPAHQAPTLPDANQLDFDFSFFDEASQLEKSAQDQGIYDNFINAYLRTVVLDLMAHLVLAAPVTAFSAAVHTVPMPQPDGSWVWTYDWRHGHETVIISLRGMPAGEVVEWDLSLIPGGMGDGVLWFSGTTSGDGEEGSWIFHDLDNEGYPVCGEISWGETAAGGNFLQFLSREQDSDGDTLRFEDNNPNFIITFAPGTGETSSFIRWHADGHGSLMVPDYNGGAEACWDEDLFNIECQ